jgi:hypothetical protein
MAGAINIAGTLTNLAQGSVTVAPPALIPNASNNYAETAVTLASGANTITVPSWAVGCLITPPTNNTQTITLKGVTGDTGVAISETAPTLLSFTTPPASFVLTAGGATSAVTSISFF